VILFTLGVSEICLSSINAAAPINLAILARDGYGVVPIYRPQPNTLLVHGSINGHDANLVLDTGWGADGISLDSGFAKILNLPLQAVKGSGTSATGARMDFKKGAAGLVTLGNVQIKGMPLFVGTVGGLKNEHIRESVGASGFVGAGFLRATSAIIDLQNLKLYLKPPGKGRRVMLGPALKAVGLFEVPFTANGHGNFLVDAEINGATGKLIMDTGAAITGVDKRFAAEIKANEYNVNAFRIDAAGVVSREQLTGVGSVKIGGVPVYARTVALTQFGFYSNDHGGAIGLLGMDVLGQNWSIIDFGQQKLYIASAK